MLVGVADDELDADGLQRSAVARLNDRPDTQQLVRVCSKSMSSPRVNDWQRLKRVAVCVKGCPGTEIMLAWQTALVRLTLHSDGGWAGNQSTRKCVSA